MSDVITWRPGPVELVVSTSTRPPGITRFGVPGDPFGENSEAALPLAEVRLAGEGNDIASSERLMGGGLSRRMRYVDHHERAHADGSSTLAVTMRDSETSLSVIYPANRVSGGDGTVDLTVFPA